MKLDEAVAIVNAGAHCAAEPLRSALFAVKAMAMAKAAKSGAPVRYLYGRDRTEILPWEEHPNLVMLEGGPYYFDLVEVALGGRAFHLPVPLAAQHGLLYAIKDLPVAFARRKSEPTGSTIARGMPPKRDLGEAARTLVEWAAR